VVVSVIGGTDIAIFDFSKAFDSAHTVGYCQSWTISVFVEEPKHGFHHFSPTEVNELYRTVPIIIPVLSGVPQGTVLNWSSAISPIC